ncbi:MAG: hypothetical protein GXP29_14305 [Planctomycetes bacterium]|nr:hypothetical protein [Planctomycetota bacterium]
MESHSSRDAVSFREILFVALFMSLGGIAYGLHKAGYTYVGLGVVGIPFLGACAIEPRIGLYAYGFWQVWDSAAVIGSSETAWLTPAKMLAFLILFTGIVPLFKHSAPFLVSRTTVYSLLAFVSVAALSVMWSYEPSKSARLAAQMFVQLALLWIYVKLISVDLAYFKRLLFWTFVGGLTAGAYTILYGMEQKSFGRATLGERSNPGSVGAALVTALSCGPVLWIFVRRAWFKGFLFAGCLVLVLAVFTTGTRSAVGAIGAGFLGAAVFSRSSGFGARLMILILTVGLAYASAMASLHSGVLGERSEARLAGWLGVAPPSGVRALHSRVGRDEIWSMAWKGYVSTKGIGAGVGAAAYANLEGAGLFKDVHSNIMGSLTEMGFPGFVSLAVVHILLLIRAWNLHWRRLTGPAIIVFSGFFMFGAVHTTYTTKLFWLPITLLVVLFEVDARMRGADADPRQPHGV